MKSLSGVRLRFDADTYASFKTNKRPSNSATWEQFKFLDKDLELNVTFQVI